MSEAVTVDPSRAPEPTADDCPNCETTLTNVQGIEACPDCRFTDF